MSLLSSGEIRNGVIGGRDGYLFLYDGGQRQFAHLVGDACPTDLSVERFAENLTGRQGFCLDRGIKYLHLVFPSKPVLATEKLPEEWQKRVKSLFLSRYADRVAGNDRDCLCYPLPMLRVRHQSRPVFRALDTHLTDFGCLSVALDVLQKLGLSYESEMFFKEMSCEVSGDLARMVGDETTEVELRIKPIHQATYYDNRPFLPGNTNNFLVIYNRSFVGPERRLLIFGDSFIKSCIDYLAPAFSDILYVRSPLFQKDIVDLFGPDVVITSNAERYLANVESDGQSRPVLMSLYGVPDYKPSTAFTEALTAQLAWRYHPDTYKRWRQKQGQLLGFPSLGTVSLNSFLQVVDPHKKSFKSSGADPYMIFQDYRLRSGTCYLFQLTMESSVDSHATLYYQDVDDVSFSEKRTLKSVVRVGTNRLSFSIEYSTLGPRLRFDPLACEGTFTLIDMTISERQA